MPPDVIDLELEKALLNVSILLVMVAPIVDPVVDLHPEPPLPVLPNDDQDPVSRIFHSGRWPTVRSWMSFRRT